MALCVKERRIPSELFDDALATYDRVHIAQRRPPEH